MNKKKFFVIAVLLTLIAAGMTILMLGNGKSSASRRVEGAESPDASAAPRASTLNEKSGEVAANLPLFHKLDENYMRGSQPSRGGVETLVKLGVKTVVDLRSQYDHTSDIGIAAERLGLRYYWLPLSVWEPATDQQAKEFISIVKDISKGPYFVFCSDGLHRTGEMSAIYRVVQYKWSVEEALKEMDEIGFNPYYYSLRNYVWTYARKFQPAAVPAKARRLSKLEQM